jgi:copper oxidase (laccase) domain-containing protein
VFHQILRQVHEDEVRQVHEDEVRQVHEDDEIIVEIEE